MRLSDIQVKEIQRILKQGFGQDCTDEHAQEVGLAVLRFVIAKAQRTSPTINEGDQ